VARGWCGQRASSAAPWRVGPAILASQSYSWLRTGIWTAAFNYFDLTDVLEQQEADPLIRERITNRAVSHGVIANENGPRLWLRGPAR
jgi:hypothetical protein